MLLAVVMIYGKIEQKTGKYEYLFVAFLHKLRYNKLQGKT